MDAEQSHFESFAWIDIALTAVPYDPTLDLVFALDHARVIRASHAEKARQYYEQWEPSTGDEIAAAAALVARKSGGRIEDLNALFDAAAQAGAFPDGRTLRSAGPSLEGLLAYLARCPRAEWARIVGAVHRQSFPRLRSEDDLLIALLSYQVERRANEASRTGQGAR